MQKNNELPIDVENMEHKVSSADDIVTATVMRSVDLSLEIGTKIAGAPLKLAAMHEQYGKLVKKKKSVIRQQLEKLLGRDDTFDNDEEKEGGKK